MSTPSTRSSTATATPRTLASSRRSLGRFRDWGFTVFAYDYRGYGTSQGKASERGAYKDIDAAYDHLTRVRWCSGGANHRLWPLGRQRARGGSGRCVGRLAGLVVESGFVTAFRVLTRVSLLPFDKFRNIDKIGKVSCPVLVMHGIAGRHHSDRPRPAPLHGRAESQSARSGWRAPGTTTSC